MISLGFGGQMFEGFTLVADCNAERGLAAGEWKLPAKPPRRQGTDGVSGAESPVWHSLSDRHGMRQTPGSSISSRGHRDPGQAQWESSRVSGFHPQPHEKKSQKETGTVQVHTFILINN